MSDFKKEISNNNDNELWENVTKKDKKYSKSNNVFFRKASPAKFKKNTQASKTPDKIIKNKIINKENIKTINLTKVENLDPLVIPAGISLNQAESLKRGNIRPEVKIDLHGFTQEKANRYLKDKLTEFHKKNIRCVLVITGKKIGKHGAEGVLKREVPKWLNLSPLRQMIIMTSWAHSRDGGEGALYVLLKKRR